MDNAWVKDSRPFIYFFSVASFTRLAKRHTRVFCVAIRNYTSLKFTHVNILLVGVFRFGHCLGETFSPISNFLSLVTSRAIKDAPHSRSWCGDPKVCLPGSLKMLDLALPEIYTPAAHLWKSVALDNACGGDSCPFIFFILACFRAFRDVPHSRFWCYDLKLCLLDFFKDATFGRFSNLHTCISLVEVCRLKQRLG